jgi:hypothetical protein
MKTTDVASGSCMKRTADPAKPIMLGKNVLTHWWIGMESHYEMRGLPTVDEVL